MNDPAKRRPRRLLATVACLATLAAGCSPTAGTHPDGGAADAGSTGTTTGALSGMAFADLCHGLAGATVSVVGTSVTTTTDDTGAFTLPEVPLPATLEVSAPGITTTRTAELDAATGLEAYAVPTDVVTQVEFLAGVTPAASRGIVEVTFVNDHQLPVAGATVSLVDDSGKDQGPPRYFTTTTNGTTGEIVPSFDPSATATAPVMGSAIFFDIRPGHYTARVTRSGYQVPDQQLDVAAGSLSVLRFVGTGTDGTAPAKVYGTVNAEPALPHYGPATPAAGVQVTLHLAGGDQTATTAADGSFSFDLTDARQEADLTFSAPGVLTQRSLLFCAGSTYFYSEVLTDTFWSQETLSPATLGGHLDLTQGQVALWVRDAVNGSTFAQGVHVAATPAVVPFYGKGTPPNPADPCAVASCQSQSDCASDTWCAADNQCRVGASPVCELCQSAGGACPNGTLATSFRVTTGSSTTVGPCVCVGTIADCTSTDCPAHTACQHNVLMVQGGTPGSGTATVQGAICAPDYSPATSTVDGPVVFPNLAPGTYTFTADDGRPPARARVEAGVEVSGDWRPSTLF